MLIIMRMVLLLIVLMNLVFNGQKPANKDSSETDEDMDDGDDEVCNKGQADFDFGKVENDGNDSENSDSKGDDVNYNSDNDGKDTYGNVTKLMMIVMSIRLVMNVIDCNNDNVGNKDKYVAENGRDTNDGKDNDNDNIMIAVTMTLKVGNDNNCNVDHKDDWDIDGGMITILKNMISKMTTMMLICW